VARRLVPYPISLAIVVAALIATTGGWIAWWNYRSGVKNVRDLASDLFQQTTREAAGRTEAFLSTAPPAAQALAGIAALDPAELETEPLARRLLAVLAANPQFKWVTYSRPSGDFVGVYRQGAAMHLNHSVPTDAKTIVDEFELKTDGTWSPIKHDETTTYDPRKRPFYILAEKERHGAWTPPYVFEEKVPGITYAMPVLRDGNLAAVITIDFHLGQLSELTRQLQFSEHGRVAILAADDVVIAHPTEEIIGANAELVSFSKLADSSLTKNPNYMSRSVSLTMPAGAPWRVIAWAPESDFTATMRARVVTSLLISGIALVIAMAVAWMLARRVSGPLTTLSAQMTRVGDLHLDDAPPGESMFREIEMMNTSLTKMTSGLRSFARYVPRDLVRTLLANGQPAELRGQLRELTIYFSDLAGFTSLAETRRPDELVQFLSEYFDDMSKIIANERGTVDKYIGDGIMAFWGAPVPLEDHAVRACIAALRCQQRVRELSMAGVQLTTRIGLATGEVLVGNIGSTERLNYTVMGDTANLASRLEGLNKQYGTDLIISEKTYDQAKSKIVARPLDVVAVKGKKEGVRVYELLAIRGEDSDAEAIESTSDRALAAYLARDFATASAAWDEILAKRPNDQPATTMRDRAREHTLHPPPPDWTGVTIAKEK